MKFKYIDAIRGIAILAVIIAHTSQYGYYISNSIINKILSAGSKGVQLFFLASAFTLFLSFDNRKHREQSPIKNFFIRRFFRIAPMYYLGIGYYLLQNGFGARYWLGDLEYISINNIISNVFFVHGFNPYWITSLVPGGWSITVEMTFYALLPLLFFFIKSLKGAINFTLMSIVLALFLNEILMANPLISFNRLWQEYLFFYFPSQLPVFGFGIIAYFLIMKRDFRISKLNCFVLIFLIFYQLIIRVLIPIHVFFGVVWLGLIFILSKYNLKLLVNRFTIFMGKISYSAYLVHFAVLYWLNEFNMVDYFANENQFYIIMNLLIRLIFVVVITSIISLVFYKLIEVPFQRIGKRLIGNFELDKIKKQIA